MIRDRQTDELRATLFQNHKTFRSALQNERKQKNQDSSWEISLKFECYL